MSDVVTLTDLQYHPDDAPLYPARLYEFDENGRYGRPLVVHNDTELEYHLKRIKPFVEAGREIRITDPGDRLVFHAKDGAVVFPTPEDCR